MPNLQRKKKIFMTNTSFLTLKVAWRIYNLRCTKSVPYNEDPDIPRDDFTVQIEFQSEGDDNFCKIHLTDFHGYDETSCYEIEPKVLLIPPYSKAPVEITVETARAFQDADVLEKTLRATAVATIYISEDNKLRNNADEDTVEDCLACYRPDGFEIDQIVTRLETKMEVPKIRLLNFSKSQALFSVKSRDVFCVASKMYKEKRKFYLKNFTHRSIFLKLLSTCPFRITKLSIAENTEVPVSKEFRIRSMSMVEIEVTLIVTQSWLFEKYEGENSYLDYPGVMKRELVCKERDYTEHIFPLYLEILKPHLVIEKNPLDFGCVLVSEYSKTCYIMVTSSLGDEPFIIEMEPEGEDCENAFEVSPPSGLFECGRAKMLTITFYPREERIYEGGFSIVTTTPKSEFFVTLLGEGCEDLVECKKNKLAYENNEVEQEDTSEF